MTEPSLAAVLSMRALGEETRMLDLRTLLAGASDTALEFEDRIQAREEWVSKLTRDDYHLTDWDEGKDLVDPLVDEVVSLLIMRLLRDRGVDLNTFEAGELLLAELVARADVPTVVLGQTQELESLDHTRAVVSLRFPGSRIWELPFLAHEFGHHATLQLRHREKALADRRPLQEARGNVVTTIKGLQPTNPNAEAHANELMADCVGTITCGPTLAVACLCLRVPAPAKAAGATKSHPSWRDRIAAMRETLDAMSEVTGLDRFRQQRMTVVDPLATAVLGTLPVATPAVQQAAQLSVGRVWDHRRGLLYLDADDAILTSELLDGRKASPAPATSVAAVLDGVWRWRMAQPSRQADDEVATLALDYCHQLNVEG